MKFRDKIKNKVKAVSKLQQIVTSKQVNQHSTFDESHFSISFTNSQSRTQTTCIKVIANWLEGYGINTKGEEAPLKIACKWFRRTQNSMQEIKNHEQNHYQLSLDDVGTTVQVQCVPEAEGIEYQGMPIIQIIGPIILDPETKAEAEELLSVEKATFCVQFREVNLSGVEEDESVISEGRITVYENKVFQIYASRKGQKGSQLLYQQEMFVTSTTYPEVLNVAENQKMVSLLINERNDFVSVELENHKVRDVFCLLIKRLKEIDQKRKEQSLFEKMQTRSEDVFVGNKESSEVRDMDAQKIQQEYYQPEQHEQKPVEIEQSEQTKLTPPIIDQPIKHEEKQQGPQQAEQTKYKLPSFLSTLQGNYSSPIKFEPLQETDLDGKQVEADVAEEQKIEELKHLPVQQQESGQMALSLQNLKEQQKDDSLVKNPQQIKHVEMEQKVQQTRNNNEQSKELESQLIKHVEQKEFGQTQKQQKAKQNQVNVQQQNSTQQTPQPGVPTQQEPTNNYIWNEDEVQKNKQPQVTNGYRQEQLGKQQVKQEQKLSQYQEEIDQIRQRTAAKQFKQEEITPQTINKLKQQIQQQQRTRLQHQLFQQLSKKHQQLKTKLQSQYQQKFYHQLNKKQLSIKKLLKQQLQAQLKPKIKSQTEKQLRPIIKAELLPVLKSQCISYFQPIIRHECVEELTPKLRDQLMVKIRGELAPKITNQLTPKIREELTIKIKEELTPKIREELRPQVSEELTPKIRDQLTPFIKQQLIPKIRQELTLKVREELIPKLKEQLTAKIKQEITPKIGQGLKPLIREQLRPKLKQQLTPLIKQQLIPQIRSQLTPKIKQELTPMLKHQLTKQLKPQLIEQLFIQKQQKLYTQSLAFEEIITATPLLNKIQPQELIYYKNELKLLQRENADLVGNARMLKERVGELEEQIKRYRPNNSSNTCNKSIVIGNDPNVGRQRQAKIEPEHKEDNLETEKSKDLIASQKDKSPPLFTSTQQQPPTSSPLTNQSSTSHQHQTLTPYQNLQQLLQKSLQQNKQLLTRQQILISQKEGLQEELMKYKVELQELEAQKKHLEKKYESLFSQLQTNSNTLNTQSNLNNLFMSSLNVSSSGNVTHNNLSQTSSLTSSPVKSMKSITSPGMKPLQQPQSPSDKYGNNNNYITNMKTSFSTNRKSITDSRFNSSPYPTTTEYPTNEYQKMSQAIMNHYSSQQELAQMKKQLMQVTEENSSLRAILQKDKKTSLPLIGSSTSSKQLKLEMIELKKLANRLTQELTEKNQVIENMKGINRELNNKLCDVTKEFHMTKMSMISNEK